MERTGLTNTDNDRCEFLRSKDMFVGADEDPSLRSGDRLFWCHKTQTCLGPDGKIADDYECSDPRPCFRKL